MSDINELNQELYGEIDYKNQLQEKYFLEFNYITTVFITDGITFDDFKLLLTIDRAYNVICKYIGYKGDYTPEYRTATISLAMSYFSNDREVYNKIKGNKTLTAQTQGSRSETYGDNKIIIDSNGLTEEVKAMLPLPKLRMVG